MIKMMASAINCILAVLLLLLSLLAESLQRQIVTSYLCNDTTAGVSVNVIYSKAVGRNNTLHYLFSTVGVPAVLVAATDHQVELNVDCSQLVNANVTELYGTVTFNKVPTFVYSLLFYRILEYNDTQDKADLQTSKDIDSHYLQHIEWENAKSLERTQDVIHLKTSNSSASLECLEDGSFSIQLTISGREDRCSELPHLQHTLDSLGIDVTFDRLKVADTSTRYALELALITSVLPQKKVMSLDVSETVDDEHTPGIFKMVDWMSDRQIVDHRQDFSQNAYLQWKPVCYTHAKREMAAATEAKQYTLQNTTNSEIHQQRSIVLAYFGDVMYRDGSDIMLTNISFGLAKDKFYANTNYTSWSGSLGYGSPPVDSVSTTVIIVIVIGLGIPVVIILIGGVGICVKKCRTPRLTSPYRAIN